MKHFGIVTVALVLLICTSVFAAGAGKITATSIRAEAENVIVPIEMSNSIPMTALDLPLKFSEGVTLVDVTFEGTRSENFDFKWATIDNDKNTVVIGLIPMVGSDIPDMEAGTGSIANLEFSIDDKNLSDFVIEATSITKPSHELLFVMTKDNNVKESPVELPAITVDLAKLFDSDLIPKSFNLGQNYPNPFNPTTTFVYDIPKASDVRIEIFNVLGQRVTTLVEAFKEAGSYPITWNGTSDAGTTVASGMYFYRIDTDNFSDTKKMMMLK